MWAKMGNDGHVEVEDLEECGNRGNMGPWEEDSRSKFPNWIFPYTPLPLRTIFIFGGSIEQLLSEMRQNFG